MKWIMYFCSVYWIWIVSALNFISPQWSFVLPYQCAAKLLNCVELIKISEALKVIVQSVSSWDAETHTHQCTQRSQRWGSEVSSVVVRDERTMEGLGVVFAAENCAVCPSSHSGLAQQFLRRMSAGVLRPRATGAPHRGSDWHVHGQR